MHRHTKLILCNYRCQCFYPDLATFYSSAAWNFIIANQEFICLFRTKLAQIIVQKSEIEPDLNYFWGKLRQLYLIKVYISFFKLSLRFRLLC